VSGRRGTKNKRTESRCAALDAPSETALLLILVTQPGRRTALDRGASPQGITSLEKDGAPGRQSPSITFNKGGCQCQKASAYPRDDLRRDIEPPGRTSGKEPARVEEHY
jgi:hypothetical protein